MAIIPAGIGAIGTAKLKCLHPSEPLRERFGVAFDRDALEGLTIERRDQGKVSRRGRVIDRYHVTHPDFAGIEFVVAALRFKVTVAGPTSFESTTTSTVQEQPTAVTDVHELAARQSTRNAVGLTPPVGRSLTREEIAELRAAGHTVDDDNEPDEENATAPPPVTGTWIIPTICPRIQRDLRKTRGKFNNYSWDLVKDMCELELFLLCFPVDYLINVVLPKTNEYLETPVTMKELFVFFGCIFFMGCHLGVGDRDQWWSKKDVSAEEGAPFRLSGYMTRNRFKAIMGALRYTDKQQPEYLDKFHDMRQLQNAWNDHMADAYCPGWWSCLDESMNVFHNQYCPGWMVVPRKPHPFGNEYHTICDGELETGNPILWHAELQEGKDRPAGAGQKKYSEFGKTPSLMLRMHEVLKRSGKACTMDSGFCVAKGIVEMEAQLGVYGQALIKKRGRYWPKGVPGDMIDDYFKDKEIGECETLQVEFEGKTLFIHCQKEEKYITKFMSTFGTLDDGHETKRTTSDGTAKRFFYPEPISWHNKAKHWVDDHNQRRHSPIDLAETWKTQWWPHRQFCFFLGLSEVNAATARGRARGEVAEPVLLFRKKLAMQMLLNNIGDDGKIITPSQRLLRSRDTIIAEHRLETRPTFTGKWTGVGWKKTKQEYQKSECRGIDGCKKRIRTYCMCNEAIPMCGDCHIIHVREI